MVNMTSNPAATTKTSPNSRRPSSARACGHRTAVPGVTGGGIGDVTEPLSFATPLALGSGPFVSGCGSRTLETRQEEAPATESRMGPGPTGPTGPARRHRQVLEFRRWWYRRGARLAQWGLGLLVVMVLAVRVASGALAPHGPGISGEQAPMTVRVEAGDTFWSVATELFPERDPRAAVDLVRRERAGRSLVPGERLTRNDLDGSRSVAVASDLSQNATVGR